MYFKVQKTCRKTLLFSVCSEFDVIFINFCNFCMILFTQSSVYVLTCHFLLKQFVRTDKGHKNLIIALNKKNMPPGSLSFENSIFKEKCGTFTKSESVKETP